MRFRTATTTIPLLATFLVCGPVRAQLTITTPETPIATRQVPSAADSPAAGIVAARRAASDPSQIRVTIQYLMLDDATRDEIYQKLEPGEIRRASFVQPPAAGKSASTPENPITASYQFESVSRVTSYVLSPAQKESVVAQANASNLSDVTRAPSVVLLQGNEAELTDMVQRPFIVDIQGYGNAIEPKVQVLDEGTRLRLLARSSKSGERTAFDLTCGVEVSRVVDVQSDKVFGARSEPLAVQVPLHRVTKANVSSSLAAGQTLLIDPHVSSSKVMAQPAEVPVLSKLPYVGRSFKNASIGETTQHMMILLYPSIEETELSSIDR